MMVYLSPMLEYPVPLPKKYQICIENGNFHLEFEYSRGGEGRRRRELSRHLQFAALIILVSSLLLLAAGSLMWRLLQSQKQGRRERRIRYQYICMGGNHFIPCIRVVDTRYVIIKLDYYFATDLKPFALDLSQFFVTLFSVQTF